MQLPVLNNGVLGSVWRRRSIIPGWVLNVFFLAVFLFMPQFFAPLLIQLLSPILPVGSFDVIEILSAAGVFVIMALGLNVVVGFAGLLDLGYAAFFAIGAYSYAMANFGAISAGETTFKFSIWPLLLAAPVITAMCGIILGAPTLRLRGDYLAIVTLGFGEIVPIIFRNVGATVVQSPFGTIRFSLGSFEGFNGLDRPASLHLPSGLLPFALGDAANFYYLVLLLVVVATIGVMLLRKSRIGRAWVAIREDETAAACAGVNLVATKLTAFAIGASVSGFAGVLYASQYGAISWTQFGFTISITILVMVVLGGMGSIPGVIVGALLLGFVNRLLIVLPAAIQDPNSLLYPLNQAVPNLDSKINESQSLIYGLILLLVILLRPQGLIPSAIRKRELKGETLAAAPEGGVLEVPAGAPESLEAIESFQELEEELEEMDMEEVVESLEGPKEKLPHKPGSGLGATGERGSQ